MTPSLRTATLALAGARGVSLALMLFVSVLLARSLGPEGYGLYVFVTATLSLAAIPAFCGWRTLVVRNTARYHLDDDWPRIAGLVRTATLWVLGVASLVAGAFVLLRVFGAQAMAGETGGLLLLGLPLLFVVGLTKVTASGLRGLHLPLRAQLPEMVIQPLVHALLLSALLGTARLGTGPAVLSMVFSFAVALVCARVFWRGTPARRAIPSFNFREWFRDLPGFAAVAFASLVSAQVAVVILGWLAAPEEVAMLRVSERAAQLVSIPLQVVNLVFAPLFARAHRQGDQAKLQATSDTAIRWSLLGALPAAAGLLFFADAVLGFVYGEAYTGGSTALRLLVLANLVNVFMGSVALLLNMSGNEKQTLRGMMLGLGVTVVLCFALIPTWGLNGAAAATLAGMVCWNLLLALRVRSVLGLAVAPWRILRPGA